MKDALTEVRNDVNHPTTEPQEQLPGKLFQRIARSLVFPGGGRSTTSDVICATDDGELFLWSGLLAQSPREISLTEAKAWIAEHCKQPDFAEPYFPEDTPAALLTIELSKARERQRPVDQDDLECALYQAQSLFALLTEALRKGEHSPKIIDGCVLLSQATSEQLFKAAGLRH